MSVKKLTKEKTFDPMVKPEGMEADEWKIIDQMQNFQTKLTAIRVFFTREERREEEKKKPSKPAELPTKAKTLKTGYIARELVLLNLPCSKPKNDVWFRKNGEYSLIVQGGYRENKKTGKLENVGVPYGSTARLVLLYIMSVAAFSETRRIYLGHSFDAFLKAIGASTERRGVKTGARAVLNQIDKLIHASIKITRSRVEDDFEIEKVEPLRMIGKSEIWFSNKNAKKAQQGLWNSYLELSEELFNSLKENPIPIDWDIVLKIRNDPTALDFYTLLTYESAKAQANKKGRFIPWASLREQMGSEMSEVKNFGRKGRSVIEKIQKEYKGLKVHFPKGGVFIEAGSLPSVAPTKRLH